MPLVDKCQIRNGKLWDTIGIEEALKRRGEDMRCEECLGRFRPHKKYIDGARAHFEHQHAHKGCSTKEQTFSGTKCRHPDPLI
jgi:hypothetical protein